MVAGGFCPPKFYPASMASNSGGTGLKPPPDTAPTLSVRACGPRGSLVSGATSLAARLPTAIRRLEDLVRPVQYHHAAAVAGGAPCRSPQRGDRMPELRRPLQSRRRPRHLSYLSSPDWACAWHRGEAKFGRDDCTRRADPPRTILGHFLLSINDMSRGLRSWPASRSSRSGEALQSRPVVLMGELGY